MPRNVLSSRTTMGGGSKEKEIRKGKRRVVGGQRLRRRRRRLYLTMFCVSLRFKSFDLTSVPDAKKTFFMRVIKRLGKVKTNLETRNRWPTIKVFISLKPSRMSLLLLFFFFLFFVKT